MIQVLLQVLDQKADVGATPRLAAVKPPLPRKAGPEPQQNAPATPMVTPPGSPATPLQSPFTSPQPSPLPASPLPEALIAAREPSDELQAEQAAHAPSAPSPNVQPGSGGDPTASSDVETALHERRLSGTQAGPSRGESPSEMPGLALQHSTSGGQAGSGALKQDKAITGRSSSGRNRSAVNYTLLAGRKEGGSGGTPKRGTPNRPDGPDKPPKLSSSKVNAGFARLAQGITPWLDGFQDLSEVVEIRNVPLTFWDLGFLLTFAMVGDCCHAH